MMVRGLEEGVVRMIPLTIIPPLSGLPPIYHSSRVIGHSKWVKVSEGEEN